MVSGFPLHYYQPPTSFYHPEISSTVDYYNYCTMADTSEEFIMPRSPDSIQSDSDNSISSTDVTTSNSIIANHTPGKQSIVKCNWQNCGVWFNSLDQLANHVSKTHASSGPGGLFYCGWEGCSRNNKGFNARYKMLVHVRTHTNQKPHQCSQCDKSFSRAENLKIHSRSHSGEKPYVCPVPGCNKAYSNSSDRFKHTRTHQVQKPYICKIPGCAKRYTDPSSLRKHVKTYKHFVNNQNSNNIVESTTKIEDEEKNHKINNITSLNFISNSDHFNEKYSTKNVIFNNENLINSHECSCPHSCCLKSCLSKATELIKFGALINFNGSNIENVTWNKLLLDPLAKQYSYEEEMDVDRPLDLTMHRNK